MSRSVIIERELKHPPERIWRALTEDFLIEEWLMKTDFQPVTGHRFRFTTDPMPHWDGIVDGVVLAVEPPARLRYEWNAGDSLRTVVTWTLEPTETGTRLRMEQIGFTAEGEQNYRGAQYGWEKFLSRLEGVLERLSW